MAKPLLFQAFKVLNYLFAYLWSHFRWPNFFNFHFNTARRRQSGGFAIFYNNFLQSNGFKSSFAMSFVVAHNTSNIRQAFSFTLKLELSETEFRLGWRQLLSIETFLIKIQMKNSALWFSVFTLLAANCQLLKPADCSYHQIYSISISCCKLLVKKTLVIFFFAKWQLRKIKELRQNIRKIETGVFTNDQP